MLKQQFSILVLILSVTNLNMFGMFKNLTQPTQNSLKNQFIATFNLSTIIPESLNTLIAYNKHKRNNAITGLLLTTPIITIAILLKTNKIGLETYYYKCKAITRQRIHPHIIDFLCLTSFMYTIKQGRSIYIRQWMIHHLKKMKNNDSNLFDQEWIKKIIHKDIKNKISRTVIIPADTKTNTTTVLDINNNATLAQILLGKYNTSKHRITTI